MPNFSGSPLSQGSYGYNINDATDLDKINMFLIICGFLDSWRKDAKMLDVVTTPELASINPAPRHDQLMGNYPERPWNAVDSSSHPRNKGCYSQWSLLQWFVQETNANHQKLQQYLPAQGTPPDLRAWLIQYPDSENIRKVGLRALADIQLKNDPIAFDKIICAIIVLHAILSKRNSFGGDVKSAFSRWSIMERLTQAERGTLDIVLTGLTTSARSPEGTTRNVWSPDLSGEIGSRFLGMGSLFSNDDDLPLSINVTADYDIPAQPMNTQLNTNFIPEGYPTPDTFNQSQTPNHYSPWAPRNPTLSPSPTMNMGYQFQSGMGEYPQLSSTAQLYGPAQQHSYMGPELATAKLDRSIPYTFFMKFLNDFMTNGDLHLIFSHDIILINQIDPPLTYHAWVGGREFLMDVESSLFSPLEKSHSLGDPLIRAIISTTRMLASHGGVQSFTKSADYMIHLSQKLLSSRKSCRSFAQAVLQTCPRSSKEHEFPITTRWDQNQDQGFEQHLDQIVKDYCGGYSPEHLFRQQNHEPSDRRTSQIEQPPRATSYQTTLSSTTSSGQDRRFHLDITTAPSANELTSNTTPSTNSIANSQRAK
ncbi:hypothetical protein F4804DRAFT_337937 [Jackrogersella minutella]|nr:hypothetical protein F4804DRAFT_337937 [Jackrogersella minutella]